MTITPEKVAELRAKATAGPYKKHVKNYASLGFSIFGVMAGNEVLMELGLDLFPVRHQDLDFMLEAPEMAALIEKQAAEIERLRGALAFYANDHAIPNQGPFGVSSNDFGDVARKALKAVVT
jgi:hypothetical protein